MAAIGPSENGTRELGSRIQGKILVIAGSDSSGGAYVFYPRSFIRSLPLVLESNEEVIVTKHKC